MTAEMTARIQNKRAELLLSYKREIEKKLRLVNKPYDENLNYLLENRVAYLRSEIVRIIKSIDYVYGQTKIYPQMKWMAKDKK